MDTLENRIQKRVHVSLYALLFLTLLLGLSVILEGCADKCEVRHQFVYFEPVYTKLSDIRAGIRITDPQPISSVGKIYFKDNYLFINEPGEGIHIINDTDKKNPLKIAFVEIPGNFDLAIKGNVLYADSYIDLVALDISNLNAIHEVERIEGIFSTYNSLGFYADEVRGVVTEWQEKEMSFEADDCNVQYQPWGGIYYDGGIAFMAAEANSFNTKTAIAPGNGSGSGLGGSLARFTINNNHLYMLDGGDVRVVDISTESTPVPKDKLYVNWDIETIFPHNNHLFIGARSGMHILDISNPETPVHISTFQHANSCDPVVVDDNYAYVTLRSGNPTCEGFDNQLDVLDITNLQSPKLVATYSMKNPHGLGVDEDLLFVCDGSDGIKMFNIEDKLKIDKNQLAHHKTIHAYDVIPFQSTLMLIGEDGIFQYDYSNLQDLKFLSHIQLEDGD
jgi:hypothetical protein